MPRIQLNRGYATRLESTCRILYNQAIDAIVDMTSSEAENPNFRSLIIVLIEQDWATLVELGH
jgi:hypothetical protein